MKFAAVLLALAALVFGAFKTYQRHAAIVNAAVAEEKARTEAYRQAALILEEQITEEIAKTAECLDKWVKASESAADMAADHARRSAAAATKHAELVRRWDNVSQSCTAAAVLMEKTCEAEIPTY